MTQMHADGASQAEIDQAIAKSDRTRALLEEGAPFEEYRAAVNGDVEGMTADRWKFISKNFRADATEDLKQSDLRVFLILADHDLNVDVADTRQVYTRVLPPDQLEVKTYSEATHDLVKKEIADSTLRTYATAIFLADCSHPASSPTSKPSSSSPRTHAADWLSPTELASPRHIPRGRGQSACSFADPRLLLAGLLSRIAGLPKLGHLASDK